MKYTLTRTPNFITIQKDERDVVRMVFSWAFWSNNWRWNFYDSNGENIGEAKLHDKQPRWFSGTNKYLLTLQEKEYTITHYLYPSSFIIQGDIDKYRLDTYISVHSPIMKNGSQIGAVDVYMSIIWFKEKAVVQVADENNIELVLAIVCFCRFIGGGSNRNI